MAEDVGFVNPEYEKRLEKIEKRLDFLVDNVGSLIEAVRHQSNAIEYILEGMGREWRDKYFRRADSAVNDVKKLIEELEKNWAKRKKSK